MTAPYQESQDHRPPGASAGTDDPEVEARAADRVIVFCDAVVAIAITLLALDLPVPDNGLSNGQFLDKLGADWDTYFAFLLSFVIIANNWTAHRRVFRYVNRMNRQVSALNMIWLLMMIVTPVAARMLAGDGAFGVRFTIYALVQIIASACFLEMNRQISRKNLLLQSAPPAARHPDSSHSITLIGMFLLSIPMAFAVSQWAYALWAAIPFLERVLRRRMASGRHTANATDRQTW